MPCVKQALNLDRGHEWHPVYQVSPEVPRLTNSQSYKDDIKLYYAILRYHPYIVSTTFFRSFLHPWFVGQAESQSEVFICHVSLLSPIG